MNADLAAAALNLIGTPFRLHGRDPARGLDCVGLVAEAMRRAGFHPVPPGGYGLRALSVDALVPMRRPAPRARAGRWRRGSGASARFRRTCWWPRPMASSTPMPAWAA
jgi:hypothetical protein